MSGGAALPGLRHRARWSILLLAVLVAAGGIAWGVPGRHAVHVGDTYDDRSVRDGDSSRQLAVRLPLTQLNLRITSGHTAGEYDDEVTAPDGASMVQVTWAPDSLVSQPAWGGADAPERHDPGADLVLVTGGHRYRLAKAVRAGDVGSSVVVVVEGDVSDSRIEARYDGRTARATAGTAHVARQRPTGGCKDPAERHPDRVFLNVACALPLHRAAYVAGLGAAPTGMEWLLLYGAGVTRSERDATVHPPGSGAEAARYVPSGRPTVSLTAKGVRGAPRLAGKDVVDGDAVVLADRAWLVPEGAEATVRLRYRLPMRLAEGRTGLPDQPARRDIDVRTEAGFPALTGIGDG